MLQKTFADNPALDNLAIIMRMYVNMLRDGKLITTDITRFLLSALICAGWVESGATSQQDCSELFNFITERLSMPMLTLKLEIAHEGLDSQEDDHKLVNERLLIINVPGATSDEPILLEQCLESYFANSVQVFRQLERRRTLDSTHSVSIPNRKRQLSICISSRDVPTDLKPVSSRSTTEDTRDDDSAISNISQFAPSTAPSTSNSNSELPSYNSLYNTSDQQAPFPYEKPSLSTLPPNTLWTPNKEFSLPAWMFLQLVPFYTNPNAGTTPANSTNENTQSNQSTVPPTTDTFVGARPIVAMCLQRTNWTDDNISYLNNRKVIVPPVIHFPNFVADSEDSLNPRDKFVLVLESVIFHRGHSTNSGHFVALARENTDIGYIETAVNGTKATNNIPIPGSKDRKNSVVSVTSSVDTNCDHSIFSSSVTGRWIFFDDLKPAGEKIVPVNFVDVFDRETPYMLFYRLVTVNEYMKESAESASSTRSSITNTPRAAPIQGSPLEERLNLNNAASINFQNLHSLKNFKFHDVESSAVSVNTVDSDLSSESSSVIMSQSATDTQNNYNRMPKLNTENSAGSKSSDDGMEPVSKQFASLDLSSKSLNSVARVPAPSAKNDYPTLSSPIPITVTSTEIQDPTTTANKKEKKKSRYTSWTNLRRSMTRPPSPVPERSTSPSKQSFRKSLELTFGRGSTNSATSSATNLSPPVPIPTYKQSLSTSPNSLEFVLPTSSSANSTTSPIRTTSNTGSGLSTVSTDESNSEAAPVTTNNATTSTTAPAAGTMPISSVEERPLTAQQLHEEMMARPPPPRIEDIKFAKFNKSGTTGLFRKGTKKGSSTISLNSDTNTNNQDSTNSNNSNIIPQDLPTFNNHSSTGNVHHHHHHHHHGKSNLTPEEAKLVQYRDEKCIIS